MRTRKTRAENQLEDQIAEIVNRRCNRMPISIMDIGKVFNAGKRAKLDGADVEAAVVAEYARCSAAVS